MSERGPSAVPEGAMSAGWICVESWLNEDGTHEFKVDWDDSTEWLTLLGLLEAARNELFYSANQEAESDG